MVAPLVGVWIEIRICRKLLLCQQVAPLVGVWIEIHLVKHGCSYLMSLPTWECGLKYSRVYRAAILGRSLPTRERGSK